MTDQSVILHETLSRSERASDPATREQRSGDADAHHRIERAGDRATIAASLARRPSGAGGQEPQAEGCPEGGQPRREERGAPAGDRCGGARGVLRPRFCGDPDRRRRGARRRRQGHHLPPLRRQGSAVSRDRHHHAGAAGRGAGGAAARRPDPRGAGAVLRHVRAGDLFDPAPQRAAPGDDRRAAVSRACRSFTTGTWSSGRSPRCGRCCGARASAASWPTIG